MCSSNFFLLAQVIPEIVLSEKPSTLKNLVYSRQMTSYVFVAYLAHYLIECVHFRAYLVKNPPAMLETWVQFLGWGDPPRGGLGNPLQYSCLEISMDRGVWRAMGSQRIEHD